jgi:hypothetical protein
MWRFGFREMLISDFTSRSGSNGGEAGYKPPAWCEEKSRRLQICLTLWWSWMERFCCYYPHGSPSASHATVWETWRRLKIWAITFTRSLQESSWNQSLLFLAASFKQRHVVHSTASQVVRVIPVGASDWVTSLTWKPLDERTQMGKRISYDMKRVACFTRHSSDIHFVP